MAMIKCKECGKDMSDKAEACPNCGHPNPLIRGYYYDVQQSKNNNINGNSNIDSLWKKYGNKKKCISQLQRINGLDENTATQITEDYMKRTGVKDKTLSFIEIIGVVALAICAVFAFGDNIGASKNNGDSENDVLEQIYEAVSESVNEDNNSEQIENNDNIVFELGDIYNDNGFNISLISADTKEMTFEILNNSEKEYDVYIYPRAINNTMEKFDHAIIETVSAGKKTDTVVDITPVNNKYDVIKSVSFMFDFYEKTDSVVSYREFQSGPIVIKTNMYDDNIEYTTYDTEYQDDNIQIGKVNISDDVVEISIINNSDNYYEINIDNTSINEWSYNVNDDIFAEIYNEPIFPHTQNILKIDYSEFVKSKNILVNTFEFCLELTCPDNIEKSYTTDKIVFTR